MNKVEKAELLVRVMAGINNLPVSYWGDSSDNWGTAARIAAIHAYNISDALNIYDIDKHDLFDFVCRNFRKLSFSEGYLTGSPYDCTGKCISASQELRKSREFILIIRKAGYDI